MVAVAQVPAWLKALYPFSPASVRTPHGAMMSYVDVGPRSDEAVLMLHGNPTWSFFYRDLIQELSGRFRCVAPDHIGMGLSEKPANYAYTLATRISDIEALVEHLGLKRVHLVVHDWGGAIGFGWATRHPEMVGKITILNTAAFVSTRIPARIALCRLPVIGEWLVRGLNGFAWPATWMAVHTKALSRDEKRAYLLPFSSWAERIAVHRFVADIPLEASHPSRAELAEVEGHLKQLVERPKLMVWGGRDFCFNDDFLRRWREIYPNARVEYLAEAGHYVLEDGGGKVCEKIREFLTV